MPEAPWWPQWAHWRRPASVAVAIALATLAVYFPVFQNELVDYDDDYYISQNPNLKLGLSAEGLRWAFTESYGANWYPLTWISLMVDYELFGISAPAFHGMNLALHAASAVLLFFVFLRMTGALAPSAFIAGVFALHPTHVESVAWAAERKDVLSALFWMLTLWAYARYAEKPAARRFALVALFLALGLLSKPMVVTLPFVLLLLDVWPLGRLGESSFARLALEKAPLFALVFVSSVVTFLAQRAEGAVQPLQTYSFGVRLANALVAYVAYIGKAFFPARLSPYYPHPGEGLPLWQALAAFVALAGATFLAVALARRSERLRFLPVGWLWYLGTLVPVIGLVQVGQQAMADRYTYLPYIGLSIVVAFGLAEIVKRGPVLVAIGAACLVAMAVTASAQVRIWRDSVTLFEHTLRVTDQNALAHINLGIAYLNRRRLEDAERELANAIEIHPGAAEAHAGLGAVRAAQGRVEEALESYRAALRLDPGSSSTHRELASLLLARGETSQALVHFREGSALAPRDGDALVDLAVGLSREGKHDEADAKFEEASRRAVDEPRLHQNWGAVLLERGEIEEAAKHFEKAIALRPEYAAARFSAAEVAMRRGDFARASSHLREIVRTEPENERAQFQLGLALANGGNLDEAYAAFEKARSLNPNRADTHYSLGLALARLGDLDRAMEHFRAAVALAPENPEAHYSLGLALAGKGNLDAAVASYRRAVELAPDYAEAFNSWGVALASAGRLREAVDKFEAALAINPMLAETHNNLGLALSQTGAQKPALEHFREAASIEPLNPDAHNNLGAALAREGRLEEAAMSFRKAIELAPNHEGARKNLEALVGNQGNRGS
jgi:tetratricopeptide (TPR) repeat protein